ncbi:MAG: hypothetical protein JXJ04_20940 [Spirochaetales bacterium]|nr:hypothetical protein [Spirochaetales bacterium]
MEEIINNLRAIIALTTLVLLFTGCNVFIDMLADMTSPDSESTPAPTYIPGPTDTDGSTYPPPAEPTPGVFTIVGQWVIAEVTLPDSLVYNFRSDGVCDVYYDYAMTVVYNSYSYSVSGNEIIFDNIYYYYMTIEDNNHFWTQSITKGLSIPIENPNKTITTRGTGGFYKHYYKIGTEPGGHYYSYFDKPALTLDNGLWNYNSIDLIGDWIIYKFTPSYTSNYSIEWADYYDDPGSYSLDIIVSCYYDDQYTPYFENMNTGQTLSLNGNQDIYLLIRSFSMNQNSIYETGNFAARITDFGGGSLYTIETFPNGGGSAADTYVFLYDNELNIIAENDDIDPGVNAYSSITAILQSGNYYLQVWDQCNYSNYYSIQVSSTGGGGSSSVVPAEEAGEADDDYTSAVFINIDEIYDRFLTPAEAPDYELDSDWFMFTVPFP